MKQTVGGRGRWRVAVAIAAIFGVLAGPLVAETARADAPLPTLTMLTTPQAIGATIVGQDAEVSVGTWSPWTSSYTYAWFRDGVQIPGATGEFYLLTTADEGQLITYSVTASYPGYQPTTYTALYGLITGPDKLPGIGTTGPGTVTSVVKEGVPVSTTAPSVSPSNALIYYQWVTRTGFSLPSTTAMTYTPDNADVGGSLELIYYVVSPGYQGFRMQEYLGQVLPITFSTNGASISGSQLVGSVLTANGGWNATPTSVDYQWFSGGTAIEGATSQTYVSEQSDIGNDLEVQMTAHLTGYPDATASATSTFTVAVAFTAPPKPTITGTAQTLSTLTADAGDWGVPGTSLTYDWYAGPTLVARGSGNTLQLDSRDVGQPMTVVVIGVAPGYGPTSSAASDPTAPVIPLPSPIIKVTIPSNIEVGDYVQSTVTPYNPNIDGAFTYVWMRNGVPVSSNTGNLYIVQFADLGATLSVVVTDADATYAPTPFSSNAVKVREGPVKGGVSIVGNVKVGSTVHVATTGWPADATNYRYVWVPFYQDNTIIGLPVATGPSFTIPASLVNHQLQVWVQATAPGYLDDSTAMIWWNSQSSVVAPGDFASSSVPIISGLPTVGTTLAASLPGLAPLAGDTVRYQWYSAATASGPMSPIAGATSRSYVPSAAMGHRFLTVKVTVTRTAYNPLTVYSAESGAVLTPAGTRLVHPPVNPHNSGLALTDP